MIASMNGQMLGYCTTTFADKFCIGSRNVSIIPNFCIDTEKNICRIVKIIGGGNYNVLGIASKFTTTLSEI